KESLTLIDEVHLPILTSLAGFQFNLWLYMLQVVPPLSVLHQGIPEAQLAWLNISLYVASNPLTGMKLAPPPFPIKQLLAHIGIGRQKAHDAYLWAKSSERDLFQGIQGG
ncbi:hypothetical protein DSO57_1009097, partial [Entomophthora muscae]